jgi:hypothetical protein
VVAQRGDSEAYDELYVYAMGRDPESFILQHAVDAYAAQTATPATKPIRLVFALVGLYLHVERGMSRKRVQRIHMRRGRHKRTWAATAPPRGRGSITAADALGVPAGTKRDRVIDAWCEAVWDAFRDSRKTIVELLRKHGIA